MIGRKLVSSTLTTGRDYNNALTPSSKVSKTKNSQLSGLLASPSRYLKKISAQKTICLLMRLKILL